MKHNNSFLVVPMLCVCVCARRINREKERHTCMHGLMYVTAYRPFGIFES